MGEPLSPNPEPDRPAGEAPPAQPAGGPPGGGRWAWSGGRWVPLADDAGAGPAEPTED